MLFSIVPSPEVRCPERTNRVIEHILVVAHAPIPESFGVGEYHFKNPRPDHQWNHDFVQQRDDIRLSPADFLLKSQHDWHPERNADQIVEMLVKKAAIPNCLEQPTIDEVRHEATDEQRITKISKRHWSVVIGNVQRAHEHCHDNATSDRDHNTEGKLRG